MTFRVHIEDAIYPIRLIKKYHGINLCLTKCINMFSVPQRGETVDGVWVDAVNHHTDRMIIDVYLVVNENLSREELIEVNEKKGWKQEDVE